MYFVSQIHKLFFSLLISYAGPEGGEGPGEELMGPRLEEPEVPEGEQGVLTELSDLTDGVLGRFERNTSDFRELDAAIAAAERGRLEETIVPTEQELSDILGREIIQGQELELSAEDRRTIFEARLEAIENGEIPHDGTEYGPVRLLEGEFVRNIAEQGGLNPELLMELRATDFEGALSWEDEDIIENYKELSQDIQRIAEEEGLDISELSTEEFIEIYEARRVEPMDPTERDARGDIIDDGAGGHQFAPETPGLQTFRDGGDVVQALPDGTYTRGGEVFSAPPGGPQSFPNYDGPAGAVDDNPGTLDGELMIREETLGTQRLAELYNQLSEEDRAQIDAIMEENAVPLQMHPIAMSDGSLQFISNPTYEPDVNGDGVSSNEAVAYAQGHNLQLPSRAQTDAARQQAQVRGAMPTHNNEGVSAETQRQNTASQRAYLEQTIRSNGNVLVGGVTKIWAFDGGRQPGLNGGIQNLQTGESWQGYSTVHGPDYADYSQAAQFVHPLRIGSDGSLEGQA